MFFEESDGDGNFKYWLAGFKIPLARLLASRFESLIDVLPSKSK